MDVAIEKKTRSILSHLKGARSVIVRYIREFTQQDGRKKRTAKQLCVTNVTGLSLVGFLAIFT